MTQRDPNHRRPSRPPAMPPPIPAAARIPVAPSPSIPAAPPEPVPIVVAPAPARRRESEGSASYGADPAADWRLLAGGSAVGLIVAVGLFAAYLASLPPSPIVVPPADFAKQGAPVIDPASQASTDGSSRSGAEQKGEDLPTDSPVVPRAMSPIPEPSGPSPEELAAEQKRMAEEAARREQEAERQARRDAFGRLRERLEQAGHLPLEADVNLQNQPEQMITLCKLDDAEVEVSLPKVPKVDLVPDKPWQLQCKAAGGNAWSITATPDEAAGQPIEIGRVEAKQDELALTLLPMPTVRDPLWVAAREAVTTAPLVLRLPGENSQKFEAFVQPCKPTRLGPIELDKLLTDRAWLPKGAKPGKVAEFGTLPGTPWPCRVELEGMGPNKIRSELTSDAPQPLAATPRPTPLRFKAIWTWSGDETAAKEPFMETTLVMQTSVGESSPVEIRVAESKVLPPWSGWQRLGELKDSGAKNPDTITQLPRLEEFRKVMPETDEIPVGTFAEYSEIARQYGLKLATKDVKAWFAGDRQAAKARRLEAWQGAIRLRLAQQGGYQRWVSQVAPRPPANRYLPNGDYIYLSDYEQMKEKYEKYAMAGEEVVAEYWRDLKGNPARHDSEKDGVILCCLHFEFQPVLEQKRKALKLLEAVGDGTVALTGRIWADPLGDGRYKVLLAEFGPADSPQPLGRLP